MSKYVLGADRVRARMAQVKPVMQRKVAEATRLGGEELIRVAKVLHPGDGVNKAAIRGTAQADGSYLADFGPKAKVTEGRSGPRPFVNPAIKATERKRKNRPRRAVRAAIKETFGG